MRRTAVATLYAVFAIGLMVPSAWHVADAAQQGDTQGARVAGKVEKSMSAFYGEIGDALVDEKVLFRACWYVAPQAGGYYSLTIFRSGRYQQVLRLYDWSNRNQLQGKLTAQQLRVVKDALPDLPQSQSYKVSEIATELYFGAAFKQDGEAVSFYCVGSPPEKIQAIVALVDPEALSKFLRRD